MPRIFANPRAGRRPTVACRGQVDSGDTAHESLHPRTQQHRGEANDAGEERHVGENRDHVRNIYHVYYDWLQECGVCHKYLKNGFGHTVILPPPPKPSTILGKIIAFFKSPAPLPKVSFEFTSAEMVYTRGLRYDRIILDLTPETYYKNRERVERAMWAECG